MMVCQLHQLFVLVKHNTIFIEPRLCKCSEFDASLNEFIRLRCVCVCFKYLLTNNARVTNFKSSTSMIV